MIITKREITKTEYKKILDDFKSIEYHYHLPNDNSKRLNVTIEDDNNEVIGFASGLINHKWFYLSDLWIQENHRKKGMGTKILKILEEDTKLKGIRHIYTWTTGYNGNDIFYEKQG